MLLLGAHFSISGGYHKAIEQAGKLKCNVVQLFLKNSVQWKTKPLSNKELKHLNELKDKYGIKFLIAHNTYLINIANKESPHYEKSLKLLEWEIKRAQEINANYYVLHPGSNPYNAIKGCMEASESLNSVLQNFQKFKIKILIENSAGQGNSIGKTFEELKLIINKCQFKENLGVCLDTCHLFAAGYPINTKTGYKHTLKLIDEIIGIDKVKLLHLNDSKREAGSKVDRHFHIGKGKIGINLFKWIMNDKLWKEIPKLIETPKESNPYYWDSLNLNTLRNLIEMQN